MGIGEGCGLVPQKMELRIPRDSEAGAAVEAVGRGAEAARRAAVFGGAAPAAAAHQTGRTSSGSCGVRHAC